MHRMLQCSLALLAFATAPLVAQQGDVSAKSPTAARIMGIIPGAGHMYAGETGRGFAYLGGVVGLVVVGGAVLVADCVGDLYSSGSDDCSSSASEDVLAVAVVGLWAWSIYDAGRAAHRTNEKNGLRTSLIIAPDRARGVRVGLSFAVR